MHTSEISEMIASSIEDKLSDARHQWMNPKNTETRHFKIDNLLPDPLAHKLFDLFPKESNLWFNRNSFRERKKTFAKLGSLDPLIEKVTDAFHAEIVVSAISKVTELSGLEPDPELYAGGISMMQRGDFLNPHIDNSHDKLRKRYRRLNLLYYVTPDWNGMNGGNLELWDKNVKAPVEIESSFNRLVVMETNRTSWHSVNPVTIDGSRCCVSNYYFSQKSPELADYYHVTSFLGRPDQHIHRLYGKVDNRLRQFVAQNLKISRGRDLGRTQ